LFGNSFFRRGRDRTGSRFGRGHRPGDDDRNVQKARSVGNEYLLADLELGRVIHAVDAGKIQLIDTVGLADPVKGLAGLHGVIYPPLGGTAEQHEGCKEGEN
jgi:hypothetical protein